MFRHAPSKLFNYFITIGLTALSIIWPDINIDKCPAIFTGNLAAQTIDLIVVSLYADDICSIDKCAKYLGLL